MYNKQKCIAVGPENSILIPAGNAHRSRTYLVCLSNATWKCHGADALCDLRSRRLKCQGLLPNPPDGNFKQHTNNSARPSHLSPPLSYRSACFGAIAFGASCARCECHTCAVRNPIHSQCLCSTSNCQRAFASACVRCVRVRVCFTCVRTKETHHRA